MKFNTKYVNVFLDPDIETINQTDTSKKVNIILSPALYWVKKVSLPVKNSRDALKLLESLFEDTLPKGDYSYTLYKENDYFYIFAYENSTILETLKKYNIQLSKVANIYFAQSELDKIDGAVKINETQSIYVKDGIVLLVPCCWIEESGELDMQNIKLSKHKVYLKQYSNVQNSSFYKIIALLCMFCIVVSFEYYITLKKNSDISAAKEKIFIKNNLKPTMLQNRSMLKKYEKIHAKQTKIREYFSYILSFKLKADEKISKIELQKNLFKVEFDNMDIKTLYLLKGYLKSKKVKFEINKQNSKVYLEMVL